jgi:glycosyltransferase involved in cell wall biosynthesis
VTIRNGIQLPSESEGEKGRGKGEKGKGKRETGARVELGFTSDDVVVGMVSNLNRPVKGIEYFIQAAPRIREAVPTARFLILGGGRLRPGYEALARELGVGDVTVFAGHKQDIGRYYAAMDVSVLTSLSEGLSITLLESQGYGVPVVVTDVGGNREVVVDGRTGYLVPPRDVDAFVDRVVELLRDAQLRQRFGAAGRKRGMEEFEIGRVAARYLALYEEVLGAKRAPNRAPAQVGTPG